MSGLFRSREKIKPHTAAARSDEAAQEFALCSKMNFAVEKGTEAEEVHPYGRSDKKGEEAVHYGFHGVLE